MQYIYTMDFYSDIKKNDIMEFARKWVGPEIIILSERSQTPYIMYFSQTEYKIKGKLQGRHRVVEREGGGGEETIIREKKTQILHFLSYVNLDLSMYPSIHLSSVCLPIYMT